MEFYGYRVPNADGERNDGGITWKRFGTKQQMNEERRRAIRISAGRGTKQGLGRKPF
ncbi:MAG: hypothetical protein GY866_04920 [Proteobacteria bacterium]|nr:hypothetical protein [Pseudomonadota bacterium]